MSGSLPYTLYTAEQMRRIDADVIRHHGISGIELMGRAGKSVFEVLLKQWPTLNRGGVLLIFCGGGNNGGDGYIVAALARQRYIPVRVIALKDPAELTGDALKAFEWYHSLGGRVQFWSEETDLTGDIIIDAMLGTGLTGPVSSYYASAIDAINRSGKPVVAVDIPSGLIANSGLSCGAVVNANYTVTFIGVKRGLMTGLASGASGKVLFADLDVPQQAYLNEPATSFLIRREELAQCIQRRPRESHKGDFGHLLVIGGNIGMGGAAIMAVEAAMRCGAGKVTLATCAEYALACTIRRPEAMAITIDDGEALKPYLEDKSAVVIGPGLGQSSWSLDLLTTVLDFAGKKQIPVLLDADALNMIAKAPDLMVPNPNFVITPHPGEAARMLGTKTPIIAENRFAAVEELQRLSGGVAVLKGAGSLVAAKEDDRIVTAICREGNPGMAVAGMGDLLCGVIGALLAQGLDVATAARMGVWLHANAGDECAMSEGEYGIAATDLLPVIRKILNSLLTSQA